MFTNLKKKIKDHKEEIAVYSVFAALIGGAVALGIYANKKAQEEIDAAVARGDLVIRLADGQTIIIPKELR